MSLLSLSLPLFTIYEILLVLSVVVAFILLLWIHQYLFLTKQVEFLHITRQYRLRVLRKVITHCRITSFYFSTDVI